MAFNGQTEIFEYSDALAVDGSSFVDTIAYDRDSRELLVVLDSGDYLYKNVPSEVFSNFKQAHSKGQYYNNWIKRGPYAPGESVYVGEIEEKSYPAVPMAGGFVDLAVSAYNDLSGASSEPKAPVGEKFRHDVKFTVDGGNNVKSYVVEAGSVSEACFALSEVAESLDIDVTVKEVTVYFE